jgi:hypothetical protein
MIERVTEEYAHFVQDAPPEEGPTDTKVFAARQAAARAALAHISELAALASEDVDEADRAEEILEAARAAMAEEDEAAPRPDDGA